MIPARVGAAASTFTPMKDNNIRSDADSLHVNAGSPPDVQRSPPSLRREREEIPLEIESESDEVVNEKVDVEDSLRFTIDPAGELTHDETTVDVITVPCPGGNPLGSWSRDGLVGRYFGAPSMRDAGGPRSNNNAGTAAADGNDRPGPSWVRQGIRREADRARILLYAHPEPATTLGRLADALLEELHALMLREKRQRFRPMLFVAHSLGGLVVKMALVKASRSAKFEGIWRECYGVAFFGESSQLLTLASAWVLNCKE